MSGHVPKRTEDPFFDAMRKQIEATPMPARSRSRIRRMLGSHRRGARWGLAGAAGLVIAGLAVAVLLVLGANAGTPPAYALTRHSDGSITVTLNNLSRGVPTLNARFRQFGIDETAIPVRADCHAPAGPSFPRSRPLHLSGLGVNGPFSSMTFSSGKGHPPPRGFRYVIAAERLPDGQVVEFIGAIKPPLPACFAP
jgi:hypothetical protein